MELQQSLTASVGRPLAEFFEAVGELSLLTSRTVGAILMGRVSLVETLRQMSVIGVFSLPIVLVTIGFSGMVLALHTAVQFHKLGGDQFIGGLVAVSMAREAAPVLASVVVAARVGSAIAAELGSMKVTEQIDALRALAVSPVQYLVVPRLLASVMMMPIVTVFANVAGILGGALVTIYFTHISNQVFISSIQAWLTWRDVVMGLAKTLVFGAIIALVGCDRGLRTAGGAAGVGRSTTSAVVLAIVLVYVSDYFLSELMFGEPRLGG